MMSISKTSFLFTKGVPILVSAKSARLKFIECGPACIKLKQCSAKCCDAPTRPDGMLVTILPSEAKAIEKQGGRVVGGLLKPETECRGCPFKGTDYLCELHNTPDKPFGCIVSPFMLNKSNKLVIRNRYKLLPCYDKKRGGAAYHVFRSSLLKVFGEKKTDKITKHLDNGGGDIFIEMEHDTYTNLRHREKGLAGTRLK